jgi:hypothetical protein
MDFQNPRQVPNDCPGEENEGYDTLSYYLYIDDEDAVSANSYRGYGNIKMELKAGVEHKL